MGVRNYGAGTSEVHTATSLKRAEDAFRGEVDAAIVRLESKINAVENRVGHWNVDAIRNMEMKHGVKACEFLKGGDRVGLLYDSYNAIRHARWQVELARYFLQLGQDHIGRLGRFDDALDDDGRIKT